MFSPANNAADGAPMFNGKSSFHTSFGGLLHQWLQTILLVSNATVWLVPDCGPSGQNSPAWWLWRMDTPCPRQCDSRVLHYSGSRLKGILYNRSRTCSIYPCVVGTRLRGSDLYGPGYSQQIPGVGNTVKCTTSATNYAPNNGNLSLGWHLIFHTFERWSLQWQLVLQCLHLVLFNFQCPNQ